MPNVSTLAFPYLFGRLLRMCALEVLDASRELHIVEISQTCVGGRPLC
jgi:hypothetical protein